MLCLSHHLAQLLLRLLERMLQQRILLVILVEGHDLGGYVFPYLLVLPLQLLNLAFRLVNGLLTTL